MRAAQRYALCALLVTLAACANMLMTEPTKVDPVEQKYIETETQLKNTYALVERLAASEKRARAAGAAPGSVITRANYFATLDRLDTFTTVVREARKLKDGSCLDVTEFKDVDLTGCLSKEQVALALLNILSKFNEGRLP